MVFLFEHLFPSALSWPPESAWSRSPSFHDPLSLVAAQLPAMHSRSGPPTDEGKQMLVCLACSNLKPCRRESDEHGKPRVGLSYSPKVAE